MESLYHPEVYFPDWFVAPQERVALKWSKHATYARVDDRYGVIPAFKTIPLSMFSVVEFAASGENVTKLVVRGKFDETRDVVFVLIPGRKHYFVKTVWFNLRTDEHKTLNRKRYANA